MTAGALRVVCGNCNRTLYFVSKLTSANRADALSHAISLEKSREEHRTRLGCVLALNIAIGEVRMPS